MSALGVQHPRCPFCHEAVTPAEPHKRACGACMGWHHDACWQEHGGCAACGAGGGASAARRPSSPTSAKAGARPARRRASSQVAVVGLGLATAAALALVTSVTTRSTVDWHERMLAAPTPEEETRWCRIGAEAGDPAAMTLLGYRLSLGLGAPCDPGQALRWELQAAEEGHPEAMFAVGTKHESGRGGVSVDEREAARWYRQAASLGNSQAALRLELLLARRPDLR